MKIVYISNQSIPSKSAESIFVAKTCDAFQQLGHDVHLFCPKRKNFYIDEDVTKYYSLKTTLNVKKIFFPLIKGKYLIYHLIVFFFLLFMRKQLVYSRTIIGGFFSCILNIPTIIELHSLPLRTSFDGLILNYLKKKKNLKMIVSISNALCEDLIELYQIRKELIHVEHDATELREITYPKYDFFEGTPIILGYVGSLYPGKGMEIISDLSKKFSGNNIQIHVYGGSDDEIMYWKKQCNKNVIFNGYIPYSKIFEAIDTFDICLLPNQAVVLCAGYKLGGTDIGKYTSPMKMFDYMVSIKPVVASDLPILREVLNNDCAYFAKSSSSSEWYIQIRNIINNPIEAKVKAINAFEMCRANYSWLGRNTRIMVEYEKRI